MAQPKELFCFHTLLFEQPTIFLKCVKLTRSNGFRAAPREEREKEVPHG